MAKVNVGDSFSRLTVLEIGFVGTDGKALALCKCACGNLKKIRTHNLIKKFKPTRSCGCVTRGGKRKKWTQPGDSSFKELLVRYKRGASQRNHCFDLSDLEFRTLVTSHCHYCGTEPFSKVHSESKMVKRSIHGNFVYNGIDRRDNNLGYTLENCLPCCIICNYAKHSMSYQDFIKYLNRVKAYQGAYEAVS